MLSRIFSLFLTATLTAIPLYASTEALNEDAFHYQKTKSAFRDMLYSQMWYFNFIDDDNGIAGVLGAGVLNPQQRMFAVGQTSAIVALVRKSTDGDSFYLWSPHYNPKTPENFSASKTFSPSRGVEFFNPAMTIKVLNPDEYFIQSSITEKDRTVNTKLTYSSVTDGLGSSWVPWYNIQLPHLFKIIPGKATYTMSMPDARVNGTVEVIEKTADGKPSSKIYSIRNARGYHDGYFGSATLIPGFKWDWLSYQQDNAAIQMIDPHGPIYKCTGSKQTCTPGNLRVSVKTLCGVETVEFNKSQIQLHYDHMKVDSQYPSVPYPDRVTIIAADAEGNRLNLNWKAQNYVKVFYHPPKPMKDLPTYEIVAHLQGSFLSSKTKQQIAIDGTGWVDYSNNP